MTMSRLRRAAALLALVAMLLLVLLPGLGRIAGEDPHAVGGGRVAHVLHADGDDRLPMGHGGADCDYCLVLGGADVPAPASAIAPRLALAIGTVRDAAAPRLADRHRDAGSRGPPAVGRS